MTFIATTITLLVLLVISALCSAAETSLTSISRIQLRRLKKSRSRGDRRIARLLDKPSRTITMLLVGNNIVNIWSSSLATAFMIGIAGENGIGIATVGMTIAILVFSEITPKTIAAGNPEPVARTLGPIIRVMDVLLRPVVVFFGGISSLFMAVVKRLFPETGHRLSEDELKTIIAVGKAEGALEAGEHALLNRAFEFTDTPVRAIMTPRTRIVAVSVDSSPAQLLEAFRKHKFSRMPVYEESIDRILGIIHYKDLLFSERAGPEAGIANLLRPVIFAPENQTTRELVSSLKKAKLNMAIVVDEHGETAGLATMDDAIAAVFGGIADEYDTGLSAPSERITVLGKNRFRVPGNLKLADLNALLGTSLDSEYYETVGGFVMEKANKLPARGETLLFEGMTFRVDEVAHRRIQQISITNI
jgi:putative hemolysin